jgi:glycosyltransferase involved in cell wall biosynthesis
MAGAAVALAVVNLIRQPQTMQPLRVSLVVRAYDQVNGLSRYDSMLYTHLQKLPEIQPRLVPVGDPALPGILTRSARRVGLDANAFFKIYPFNWPEGDATADVVHLTHRTHATLLYRRFRQPVVVTVHDVIHYQHRQDPSMHIYRHQVQKQFDTLSIRALRRATAIVASSQYTRQVLLTELNLPPDKVYSVPLGVDQQRFSPRTAPDWFLDKYGLARDGIYVLHVGTDEARKNLATLVTAFSMVHATHPQARLLRVGRPLYAEQRHSLVEQVRSLGLENSVTMIDDVPDDELGFFYNLARVFVFPSLAEGFGLPVLEAMACGTPVVCSNTTSLPEIAADAALLIDPADATALAEAIAVLFQDETRWAHCREAGIERAAQFSWQHTADKTAEVYAQMVEAARA